MGEYFFGITDKGRQRQDNEDTFIVQELPGKELVVACVIDGVGGYSGGEVAAEIARTVILEHLQQHSPDILQTLREAIVDANTKIWDEKKRDGKNDQMACVLTCAVTDIKNNKLYYAHIGDTRLYLLRDKSLVKLSRDHSVIGFLEESGKLSEEEAMRHPRRNEINKALGFEEQITVLEDFVETGESPFLPADIIFLCSDGVSDMINSNAISSILVKDISVAEKAAELVDAANAAGGEDNITAVIVENNKQPRPQVALKPVERKRTDEKSSGIVKQLPGKATAAKEKKGRNLPAFLTMLLVGFLLIILFQNSTRPKKNDAVLKASIEKIKNENADQLVSHAADSTRLYALQQKETFIKLITPVFISKDTFTLKGNGTIITCDSNYKSPAFIIDKAATHIILDSLVFKDMDVAVVVQKNNLVLKNVRFINCRVPVQYQLSFADSTISGRFKDSIFIPSTTLKLKK